MRHIALVVLLTVPACAAATLTEAGSRVRVMKADPPAGCQEIGAVSGGDREKIAIRNSAGVKGANYVRMETVTPNGNLTGTAFKCPESANPTAAQ